MAASNISSTLHGSVDRLTEAIDRLVKQHANKPCVKRKAPLVKTPTPQAKRLREGDVLDYKTPQNNQFIVENIELLDGLLTQEAPSFLR